MCGLAGFFGSFDESLLGLMGKAIAHRGPDDSGQVFLPNDGIGLVHRRLSIIDLSDSGHQPMWDPTGTTVIVYNGEIFNYRELRLELEAGGFVFRGTSDTEVVLNLYVRDGVELLSRLNGMYALAIWDRGHRRLFLARDGVGVKPLYLTTTPRGILFASEMKALLKESSVDRTLNSRAVDEYVAYLWCTAPKTILKSVEKVPPGTAILAEQCRIVRRWTHYDLPYGSPIEDLGVDDAAERVRDCVRAAVERQMVSDVPVGAFLSGGLDSSAVVAMARVQAGKGGLRCFTIGFRSSLADTDGSEEDLPYARAVARHLEVDLNTVLVGPELIDRLEDMIFHLDEPQADPACLNVLAISELAQKQGIRVLLSGAGGDDIFAGYRRHYALSQEYHWEWLPKVIRSVLSRMARRVSADRTVGRRFRKALEYAELDGDERIASYFSWIRPEWLSRLRGRVVEPPGERSYEALVETLKKLPPDTPPLNKMLYLEGKHFLPDHNLNYTDKMSMAVGVEVRVPLLDPDVIRLATQLPLHYKLHGSTGKWIFKRAMEEYLPKSVLYRPKTGFGAPLRYWLRNELKPVVEDTLSESVISRRGLFDPKAVRDLIKADRAGKIDAAYPIFSLMCIEMWCRTFLDVAC